MKYFTIYACAQLFICSDAVRDIRSSSQIPRTPNRSGLSLMLQGNFSGCCPNDDREGSAGFEIFAAESSGGDIVELDDGREGLRGGGKGGRWCL